MQESRTRNQHFVTQAEQRLNAINPHADPNRMRIYSFDVIDRDTYTLELESPTGRPISKNLSLLDLFTFDVVDNGVIRHNFETLFQKYENQIALHTRSLLSKLNAGRADCKDEIVDLFAAKLLNFVRNPYCITKVLNTFPVLASLEPTDPILLKAYQRVLIGRKPHQTYLCEKLGISDAQYIEWLRVLFMLLTPMANGHTNFFELVIKGMMEDRKTYLAAFVFEYDSARCLLSDRSFSQPIEDGPHASFSFNMCSNAFIDFIFANPGAILQGKAEPDFVEHAIACWERLPEQKIHVTFDRNNLAMLKRYNQRVVEQCNRRVFCSSKDGIII